MQWQSERGPARWLESFGYFSVNMYASVFIYIYIILSLNLLFILFFFNVSCHFCFFSTFSDFLVTLPLFYCSCIYRWLVSTHSHVYMHPTYLKKIFLLLFKLLCPQHFLEILSISISMCRCVCHALWRVAVEKRCVFVCVCVCVGGK